MVKGRTVQQVTRFSVTTEVKSINRVTENPQHTAWHSGKKPSGEHDTELHREGQEDLVRERPGQRRVTEVQKRATV